MKWIKALSFTLVFCTFMTSSHSENLGGNWETAAEESHYYKLVDIPISEDIKIEAGSFDMLPDGRLAIGTRRGQILLVSGVFDKIPQPKYHVFAEGLEQIFGLSYNAKEKAFYITQQAEVTRIQDLDGDDRADDFETLSDDWDYKDYHEFSFGSKQDKNGDIWVTLGLTKSYHATNRFRGWGMKVSPHGKTTAVISGVRSSCGTGMGPDNTTAFFTESQGPWNSCCSLKHMKPGATVGHPASYAWYHLVPHMGPQPVMPNSNSRMLTELKRVKELIPPVIMFPYKKMGRSISGFSVDTTQGKFGPFAGQLFVGDYTLSFVMRATVEKVNGVWQGACYPFREGFATGLLANQFAPNGMMVVGGTSRGWPIRGAKNFSLQRVEWTGKTPFEIKEINALSNGYRFHFTQPVDPKNARNPNHYRCVTYTYPYWSNYGGSEVDHENRAVEKVTVAEDGLSVDLKMDLRKGYIHEFDLTPIRSHKGKKLVHVNAYYTLNEILKK